MGFITGFTGGVALTLSLAYISIAELQRKRETQSRLLREQKWMIQNITDPDDNARQWQQPRSTTVSIEQLAKDRWNQEIERAVRWAQKTNWTAIGQGLERRVAALWAEHGEERLADGEARAREALDQVKEKGAQAAAKMEDGARRAAARAEDEARRAAARAEDEARRVAARAEDETRRAASRFQDEARQMGAEAQDKAQGVLASALDRVKTAVGWAEAEVVAVAKEQAAGESPVEKALRQRFEKGGAGMERAAEEVLRERYRPLGERDNTVLRGL
ncbi:hypothetical protein CDD80_6908 [Ophiocordyceps camponoti-rufipedis]|uniref:MICOS complex subunit MIC12 n=1 Tax=Ophiocordyceps camponoti-rufipedis TaxID=2004952 RepID=A0A2C5YRV9_9HYPO|nr:hypothetical protein CDD80_6908 [Ophiocordyceps camponoti-rufipedis]